MSHDLRSAVTPGYLRAALRKARCPEWYDIDAGALFSILPIDGHYGADRAGLLTISNPATGDPPATFFVPYEYGAHSIHYILKITPEPVAPVKSFTLRDAIRRLFEEYQQPGMIKPGRTDNPTSDDLVSTADGAGS